MAFGRKKKADAAEAPQSDLAEIPVAVRGTMALVLEPGSVKRVHFDGVDVSPPVEPSDSAPFEEIPDAPSAPTIPAPSGRRRTLYETDRGNQVVAYEGDGSRSFATTSPWGERPFHPDADVDPLVKDVALEQTRVVSDHTYHPVVPVVAVKSVRPRLVEAWEPSGESRARPATVRSVPAKPSTRRKARSAKRVKKVVRKAAKRRAHTDFPGDDHLVIDLEGIGPIYAKKLQKQGVYTTSRLAYESPGNLANRIKAPRKLVKNWRNMAELIKAKGIGKQYAEVLVRSGVKGIDDLKARKPATLAKQVNKFLRSVDSTVLGTGVHEKRANAWIKAAKKMKRRVLPVPRKGPPQTEIVKGFIQKLPKYGAKKVSKKAAKKTSKKTARKAGRKKR